MPKGNEGAWNGMKLSTLSLDHLGLVAGIFDELNISEVIDDAIPKTRDYKLPHSAIIKGLVINGLGFRERRLYIYPTYFKDLALEKLFGSGISPEDFNEDSVGRTLDRINRFGSTKLFNLIAMKCMQQLAFDTHLLHVDTTSFSVHGQYEGDDCQPAIEMTFGHPKDGRWDLKQFVLSMVTNQYGIPLFVEAHSGNKSDKKTLIETIEKFKSNLNFSDKIYFVADSAFFSSENINLLGDRTLWITRVPSTVGQAKDLLDRNLEMKSCLDDRYSIFETFVNYGDINQKWVVVDSTEMHARKVKTFDRLIEKEFTQARKSVKKLRNVVFACEADARNAANRWMSDNPRFLLRNVSTYTICRRIDAKRGRPKKGESLDTGYIVEAEVDRNEQMIASQRDKLGRFVLASNDLAMNGELMLQYYKGQNAVEKGFRFLKDKSFRVAEVYLKKEERIEALSMIMVLSLLIYSIAEWILRKRLKETGETVLNQIGKPTQQPTLKWIFQKFRNINEAIIELKGSVRREIINVNDEQRKIVELFGQGCEKYYI
jgi:transposase